MNKLLIVTLDHNCIIALEHRDEPHYQSIVEAVNALIRYQNANMIALKVSLSTGLENQRPEEKRDFPELVAHYTSLGLVNAELLRGPQPMGFTIGESATIHFGVDLDYRFLQRIHALLHPTIAFDLPTYRRKYCEERGLDATLIEQIAQYQDKFVRTFQMKPPKQTEIERIMAEHPDLVAAEKRIQQKWNNAKSDSLGLCDHVSWGGDIFVTNDADFFKPGTHDELERLINGKILRPAAAVAMITEKIGELPDAS